MDIPLTQLPEIPGGWSVESITIDDWQFRLTVPAVPDAFLEDPQVQDANVRDDYMPYWSYLWPASVSMARAILSTAWPSDTKALEIGCGIGLAGLAALAKGMHVVFSDYDETAVQLAVRNAHQNGFSDCDGMVLDWRTPPPMTYRLILGCDVVYEQKHHQPILDLVSSMLAADGQCWIADGGRQLAESFVDRALQQDFKITFRDETGPLSAGKPTLQVGQFRILSLAR